MEDVELSKRLKRLSRPLCIGSPLVTSSRRWEQRGIWRTILLMWKLRFLYFLGVLALLVWLNNMITPRIGEICREVSAGLYHSVCKDSGTR